MSFRLLSPRFGLGVLVAVVTAIHASAVHTEFIDDAYISFRYSWHLAHGNGLTFNVGDPVEGYSNLTWVWLGAAVIKLGIPLEPGIKCLAVAFLAATPVFLYALLLRLGATLPHAAVTALLLASMTSWVVPMVNGLEGALFSFLLLVVTSLTWRNSTAASRTVVIASGLAGFLLAATRPEGAALYLSQLGVALIFCAAYRNKVGWRAHLLSLATFLAAIGVLTAWRLATYGSMLPNTVIAKMNRQSRIFSRIVLSVSGDGFQYCLAFFFETLPVWLLIGMGTLWMWRLGSSSEAKPRSLLAVLAAVVPPLAFILVLANNGDWMPHFRLLAPILPLLVLIAGALLIGSPRWTLVAFAAATIASVSPRNCPRRACACRIVC